MDILYDKKKQIMDVPLLSVTASETESQQAVASASETESQQAVAYGRLVKTADAKIRSPFVVQFTQGLLAGAMLSLGAMNANLVEANVKADDSISTLSNLLGGAVFPVGLIGIFLTGANLFTGNCMCVLERVAASAAERTVHGIYLRESTT